MPRPSDSAVNKKPRRRRRFARQKRVDLNNHQQPGRGSGSFANGVRVSLGPITWLWHVTTSTLGWSSPDIDGIGGGAGEEGRSTNGIGPSSGAVVVLFVAVATGGIIILR